MGQQVNHFQMPYSLLSQTMCVLQLVDVVQNEGYEKFIRGSHLGKIRKMNWTEKTLHSLILI